MFPNIPEVVIRTNGYETYVLVDAEKDVVNHYGKAGSVSIKAIAATSYHENGFVAIVDIANGRIALEKGSSVKYLHFDYDKVNQRFNDIVVAYDSSVILPTFSRDVVENIAAGGTLVVELQDSTDIDNHDSDYVYLYQQGLIQQIRVADTKVDNATDAKKATDSSVDAKTNKAAQQIANNLKAGVIYEDVKNEDGSVDTSKVNENGYTVNERQELIKTVVEEAVKINAQEQVATAFAGGSGTAEDPWLIYDYATMQRISQYYDEGYHYYKVAIDKCAKDSNGNAIIDCAHWIPVNLNGSFDGNGVKFVNLDNYLFDKTIGKDGSEYKDYTIGNFNAYNVKIRSISNMGGLIRNVDGGTIVTFEDISISGLIQGTTHTGSLIGAFYFNGENPSKLQLKNITSSATLYATNGSVGGFVGNPLNVGNAAKNHIYVENIQYTGSMYSSNGCSAYFQAHDNGGVVWHLDKKTYDACPTVWKGNAQTPTVNANNEREVEQYHWALIEKNNKFVEFIFNTDYSPYGAGGQYSKYTKIETKSVTNNFAKGEVVSVPANSKASYAIAVLFISPNDAENEDGCYTNAYKTETLSIDGGNFTTTKIFNCDIKINGTDTNRTGYTSDKTLFNIVRADYGKTHGGAYISFTQYDENDNIVEITTISVAQAITPEKVHVAVGTLSNTVADVLEDRSFTFDTRVDLSNYNVTIQFIDRSGSTWGYSVDAGDNNELMSSASYSINGSKITIKVCECRPITSNYDYFVRQIGKDQVMGDQYKKILITYTQK